jgi:nucleoside-diphosphate-sugar epimerase/carbamoylphosphate synthase large subunit
MSKRIKVLVTCIGSGIGQSVIDSLQPHRDKYLVFGLDQTNISFAATLIDIFIHLPYVHRERYTTEILSVCIENNIDVLIPGNDFELELFSKEKEKFHNLGIEVMVSSYDLNRISRNKKDWYDYFSPKGINIVPTRLVKDFSSAPDPSFYPAIVKPSGGSSSQGIKIILEENDLVGVDEQMIIQPYLFPLPEDPNFKTIQESVDNKKLIQISEISIQLLFDKNHHCFSKFISENRLKNGIPITIKPIEYESFKYNNEIEKFIKELTIDKAVGPVNIQGRITEKGLFFFEMNLRFTGITGTRAILGFNEIHRLVSCFKLDIKNESTYNLNKVGVRQVACKTLNTIREKNEFKHMGIYGGGSNFCYNYILDVHKKFKKITIISREGSYERISSMYDAFDNIVIVLFTENLHEIMCNVDVFINFASALVPTPEVEKYKTISNVFQLISLVKYANIPLIINVSSQSVYDQKKNEIKDELSPTTITDAYSFQKIILEEFFDSVNMENPNSLVKSLRFSRIIDPTSKSSSGFFGKIVNNYKNGLSTTISQPKSRTNLIHIQDAIKAIDFVIDNCYDIPNKINFGGENFSLEEFCHMVINKCAHKHKSSAIEFIDSDIKITNSTINNKKALELGWRNKISIEEIIDVMYTINQ